jgi:hypothetical protein
MTVQARVARKSYFSSGRGGKLCYIASRSISSSSKRCNAAARRLLLSPYFETVSTAVLFAGFSGKGRTTATAQQQQLVKKSNGLTFSKAVNCFKDCLQRQRQQKERLSRECFARTSLSEN